MRVLRNAATALALTCLLVVAGHANAGSAPAPGDVAEKTSVGDKARSACTARWTELADMRAFCE